MKTYTFKIKVDSDKVVIAVNMQLEQFYDCVKLTNLKELCERYPHAYITACDYYNDDEFIKDDYCLSSLRSLLDSKDLKSYLISSEFFGFVGDDSFNPDVGDSFMDKAHDYILSVQVNDVDAFDMEVDDNGLSENEER